MLIEPIAMKTDMWQWRNNVVPLQNYIGWFAVALPLQILFFKFIGGVKNIVAVALFILQFVFFALLNWFLL
jgi:bisanhydrobacterioruberin hydratase